MTEWRSVFWVTLAILLVTTVIYIIWGSAEVQLFNDVEALKEHKAEKKRLKEEAKALKAANKELSAKSSAAPSVASAKSK